VNHPKRCPELFLEEYLFINDFAAYGKTISIWKGIVMGGGLGVSSFSRYTIATDSTVWAMPESAIGLVNDVGSNYILSHMRSDAVGLFLGITGHRLNGADCYFEGLATHYIPDSRLPELLEALPNSPEAQIPDLLASYH
jgi:3-hydroxyisobutyryl-CoA hydrolase